VVDLEERKLNEVELITKKAQDQEKES